MHYNWDIARDINIFQENVIPYLRNPIRRGGNPAATPSALADWGYLVTNNNNDELTPLGVATRDIEISWSDSVLLALSKRNASWQQSTIKPIVVLAKYITQLIIKKHQNIYITKADLTKLMHIEDYDEISSAFCDKVLQSVDRFQNPSSREYRYHDIWFNALGETPLFFSKKENNVPIMCFNHSAYSEAFIQEIARLGPSISICPPKSNRAEYYLYQGSITNGIMEILPEFNDLANASHICPTLCALCKNEMTHSTDNPIVRKKPILVGNNTIQQIYYGAPGTGKSHTINKVTKGHKTFRTTFHPDSDYSTFVGSYKPVMEEVETRVIPVVLNNGTIFDQNNGTLKEKKIGYKFVKQAFMKAYIAAWRTFTNNSNVTITTQAPSPISLSYNNQTWILTAVSDDSVLYTKEDIMSVDEYKNNVLTYWPTMPDPDENGKFKLGTFDHYQAAGCAWYRGKNGKNHSANECWEAIKNVLEAGGAIEATPNSQTYSILLRDGKLVAITRDNKANKSTIKRCFENADADSSVQKRIAKELKEFNANDFDKAWEELKTRVNGMVIPESANTEEIPPVFLIIEEINRGNCAQIFGDLFQLLDRKEGFSQYPIYADDDIRKCLVGEHTDDDPSFGTNGLAFSEEQKSLINSVLDCEDDVAAKIACGEVLVLPPNLYIWATMNTSDQSLFPIDSAFKRRWDWKYRPITKGRDNDGSELNWRIKADTKEYDWWSFLVKINEIIGSTTNSEDKKLGFFFCKPTDGVISAETFVGKVIFYLWNDVFKDFGFDEDIFHDEKLEDGTYSTLNFNKFYTTTAAGETIVLKDKVEKFLDNLKVEEAIIDDSKSVGNFSLDGVKGMTLGEIAKEIVTKYAENNLGKSAQEIRNIFVEQCKGIGVSHIVETEEEYHKRDGQASQERSASEITIPNGEKLYVTTQWRAKKDSDNFIKFIDIVGRNGWGTITPAR